MSDPERRKSSASLLERAADVYDFGAYHAPANEHAPFPVRVERSRDTAPDPGFSTSLETNGVEMCIVTGAPRATSGTVAIDRDLLADQGLLVPGAPIGALAEEFRLVKRQLLTTARAVRGHDEALSRAVLVCSARPDDGKTYCAVNLAISLAAERDVEVLLIDADFAKPDVMARLGLREGPGLLDALANPSIDVEGCILRTDIAQLSLLPCGTKTISDTELVASKRTGEIIASLLAADERRILVFDSPPVLAASPASVLAGHVGQVMLVVRADRTGETDLREAVMLLDGCEHIQLVLNAVSFALGGRRFGSYYGQQEDAT